MTHENDDNKNLQEQKPEDLLSDHEALGKIISEGEKKLNAEDSVSASSSEQSSETPVVEPEKIKIHSDNPNMKWYIVYVRTGMEQKAKEQLEIKIKSHNKFSDFGHVLVPSENVVEISKGKKKTASRKFFPGYMLVQMVMNEDNWHFVKSTPRIVGFVGGNVNPPEINEKEVMKITAQVEQGAVKSTPRVSFEEGENVRVIDGPFTNFTGIVEEVKPDKAKVKVLVSIFGRSTPVELEFVQVEKI
jgi:transcription termination/antitermination protein NusG